MVTIKEAVASAKAFAQETLGVDEALLEELRSDENQFEVTLSFPKRLQAGDSYMEAYRGRELKTFDVAKSTGQVLGMKIRAL